MSHTRELQHKTPNMNNSAVALGIVKAWYQIGFSSDTDKTFNQYIQFYGLCVPPARDLHSPHLLTCRSLASSLTSA